jgi:hypothetical protein
MNEANAESISSLSERAHRQRLALIEALQTPRGSISGLPQSQFKEQIIHTIQKYPKASLAVAGAVGMAAAHWTTRAGSSASGLVGAAVVPFAVQLIKNRLLPWGMQWAVASALPAILEKTRKSWDGPMTPGPL